LKNSDFLKELKSNSDLIKLLNKGDIVAFDTIYERYCHRLYGFVLRYLKYGDDAEEIVQEVFLKIWESRQKISNYSTFDSFIFTIAYNSTISLLRRRVTEQKYLDNLRLRQQIASTPHLIDEIQFRELDEKVRSLLIRLTPRQLEIFRLSREDGLTHEEIAKKLNISSNTVKNHLVTALAFLKSELDNGLIVNLLFVYLFF
jgi:RNA polymerase sigma-70 factor, ECF subfamily